MRKNKEIIKKQIKKYLNKYIDRDKSIWEPINMKIDYFYNNIKNEVKHD